MAEYNLGKNHKDRQRAIDRFKELLDQEKIVEIIVRKQRRSLDQNGWMHLLFTFYAIEFSLTMYEAKEHLKKTCPFMKYEKVITETGEQIVFFKQTSRLSMEDCSAFIEWIYDYAGTHGCHLPSKEEYVANKHMYQKLIRSHRQYL